MISSSIRFRYALVLLAMVLALALTTAQQADAQEVSQAAATMVGQQLTGAFTPDASEHLWFDVGDGSFLMRIRWTPILGPSTGSVTSS